MTLLRQNTSLPSRFFKSLSHLLGITRSFETGERFFTRVKVSRPAFLGPLVQQQICGLHGVVHIHLQTNLQPDRYGWRKPLPVHAHKCGNGEVVAR